MKAIIFDVDGTLADNAHRQHHVQKTPKDWASFYADLHLDKPYPMVVDLAAMMQQHYPLLFCSGRLEEYRETTLRWLADNTPLRVDRLYMRATGDFRGDDVVKSELLDRMRADGFEPWLAVDDRDQVVRMWRERGLLCLQCAYGSF
jgi:phosphoglycolate phosphatase-like HAD superfamily hydrolase